MKQVAFICKANVQRSQIAEGLFKQLHPNIKCISFAGIEARKEKYNFKTEKSVSKIAQEKDNINIKDQNINYISDFDNEILSSVDLFVFLFNPNKEVTAEAECLLDNSTPYKYISEKLHGNILIHEITDPYIATEKEKLRIYNNIKTLIKKLSQLR